MISPLAGADPEDSGSPPPLTNDWVIETKKNHPVSVALLSVVEEEEEETKEQTQKSTKGAHRDHFSVLLLSVVEEEGGGEREIRVGFVNLPMCPSRADKPVKK